MSVRSKLSQSRSLMQLINYLSVMISTEIKKAHKKSHTTQKFPSLTASAPVSASFIELDAATAFHLGLMIKLTENPGKIAAKMARPIRSQDPLLVI